MKCIKHGHKCISYPHAAALWVEIQPEVKNGCRKEIEVEKDEKNNAQTRVVCLVGVPPLRGERCILQLLIFSPFVTTIGDKMLKRVH